MRTLFELIISSSLFVWLILSGYEPLFGKNHTGSALFGTKYALCKVVNHWYLNNNSIAENTLTKAGNISQIIYNYLHESLF